MKRHECVGDALKREGFEVKPYTQASFALTTLEYDTPAAILCATNMREMGALEMARIIHADPKNVALMIIALGDGSQRALMEAFQSGCDDYIESGELVDCLLCCTSIHSLFSNELGGVGFLLACKYGCRNAD